MFTKAATSIICIMIFIWNCGNGAVLPHLSDTQRLLSDNGGTNFHFGASVALSSSTLVIGEPNADSGRGRAHIFAENATGWHETQMISAGSPNDYFGTSVSVSDAFIGSGAYMDDVSAGESGTAYVYDKNGDIWSQMQQINAFDAAGNDKFAEYMAIGEHILIVGVPRDDDKGAESGSVYVYRHNMTWGFEQKIVASDGVAADLFGYSLATNDEIIVIGALGNDQGASGAGAAYVYRYNGTWVLIQKLMSTVVNARFGCSVDISVDNNIAVGACGSQLVHMFTFNDTLDQWIHADVLVAHDKQVGDEFGNDLSINKYGTVVVGAPNCNSDTGAAYVYVMCRNGSRMEALRYDQGDTGDTLGRRVAINDAGVVAMACKDDDNVLGLGAGSVVIGKLQCPPGYIFVPGTQYCDILEPTILDIEPAFGPMTGNTTMQISGYGFDMLSHILVHFGNITVPGTFNTSRLITCVSPVSDIGAVDVWINGTNKVSFVFYEQISLVSFRSRAGPVSGGTTVTVQGHHLSATGSAWCRFGHEVVKSSQVREEYVLCTTPTAAVAGDVELSVSLNEQQFSIAMHTYRYYDMVPISLHPLSGPISGGTVIALNATDMVYVDDPILIKIVSSDITEHVVNATWNSTVLFVTPDLSIGTSVVFPHEAQVSLSFNGQYQWTDVTLPFTLYESQSEVRLTSMDVISGPADGLTNVTLTGSNYIDTGEIAVSVGSVIVPAHFLDTSHVAVTVPPGLRGAIDMRVALNGQQYTTDTQEFTYYQIDSVSPWLGPTSGGTAVTISGSVFVSSGGSSNIMCRFGNADPVIATSHTSDKVVCTAPSGPQSTVAVQLTMNGVGYTMSPLTTFNYYSLPTVASVQPSLCTQHGGITSLVKGGPFLNSSLLHVWFVDVNSQWEKQCPHFTFINHTTLMVTVPSIADLTLSYPQYAHVRVRQNSEVIGESSGDVQFRFGSIRAIFGATPLLITPMLSTTVAVTGMNMGTIGSQPLCRYTSDAAGSVTVSGTVISNTHVICPAPLWSDYPNNASLPASIALSLPKADNSSEYWATLPVSLTYYSPVSIIALTPTSGPASGGVMVSIQTSGMINSAHLACKFGDEIAPASFYTSEMIKCIAPAHPASSVPVTVTLNRQHYHPLVIGEAPIFECMPCPAGQYAATYTDVCKNCSAGSYSSNAGAKMCLPCDRDKWCAIGSVDPIQCPENTVSRMASTSVIDCACRSGAYDEFGSKVGGVPCSDCSQLRGAVCPGGTQIPYPQNGWWSNRERGQKLQFFPCPAGNVSCSGGPNATSECRQGYKGRMCADCIKGFYRVESLCYECPENAGLGIALGVVAFMLLIFVVKRFGGVGQGGALSVSISYVQITALFAEFRLQWPQAVLDFLSWLSVFNVNFDITAPECTIDNWNYGSRFAFTMCLPLINIGIILFWFGWSCLHYVIVKKCCSNVSCGGGKLRRWLLDVDDPSTSFKSSVGVFLVCMSLLYIILASKSLEPFDCTAIAGGTASTLDAYPEMLCWQGEHMSIVPWAVVFTVLYVVGIPLMFLAILFINRRRVQTSLETSFRRMVGCLFIRFSPKWFWWEAVIMMRKLLIIIVRQNFTNYPLFQGVIGVVVLLIFLGAHLSASPFVKHAHNRLETLLLFCNFLILLSGIMFLADKFYPEYLRDWASIGTIVILIVSLLGIVCLVLVESRAIYSVLAAKRKANESYTWTYWSSHLPTSWIPILQEWMSKASEDQLGRVEQMTKRITDTPPSSDDDDVARALVSVTFENRRNLQSVLGILASQIGTNDLMEFMVSLKRTKQRPRTLRWKGKNENEEVEMGDVGSGVRV